MATIINGVVYSGGNITIGNNKIVIDGKDATPDSKIITIQVNADITTLSVDMCNELKISGNVGSVKTLSGDVEISGNVNGSVQTMSGDVDCGNIGGSVSTMSGDIKQRKY